MEGLSGSHSSPDLNGEHQEKPNFRSCGRFAQKVQPVHAGTVRQPDAVPTIPSRIETTLYKGRREKNGFGSHTMRFSENDYGDPDAPGPGNYYEGGCSKVFHEELTERFGWGARGTGGFASRSRRFGARSLPTMPVPGRGCPGPGMYAATAVVNKLRDRTDHLKANSAVFAASAPECQAAQRRSASVPIPGPGQHTLPSCIPGPGQKGHPGAPNVNAALAAFRSLSKRDKAGPEQGDDPGTMPGPGQYYSQKPILPPNGSGHEGGNAVFKEPSSRRFCAVHPDLPVASDKALVALGDFGTTVAKECVGDRITDLPGPGQYPVDRDKIWEGMFAGVSGLSSFQPGSKRTDWGSKEIGEMPGPGHYKLKDVRLSCLTDAKSSFNSASEQHGFADLSKMPGPCYYKPPNMKLNPRQSFILNSKKRFL